MYRQETILYKDTYNIHITKDYVDNILVQETHYNKNNIAIYTYRKYAWVDNEVTFRYYYVNLEVSYCLYELKDSNKLTKIYHPYNIIDYVIDDKTCTEICTMNYNAAIHYIQNYIKKQI